MTHALVNEEGTIIVAAESGQVILWDLGTKSVIFSDECKGIVQMAFNKQQTKLLVVRTKKGEVVDLNLIGENLFEGARPR